MSGRMGQTRGEDVCYEAARIVKQRQTVIFILKVSKQLKYSIRHTIKPCALCVEYFGCRRLLSICSWCLGRAFDMLNLRKGGTGQVNMQSTFVPQPRM